MLVQQATTKAIQKAREFLRKGEIIIYPTDTLYGLGADIKNEKAIKKIFAIKKRPFSAPISVLVNNLKDIHKIAKVNSAQQKKIESLLPGPWTVILPKKEEISPYLTAHSDKIGVRVVDNNICRQLTKDLPITTTSANLSGIKPVQSPKQIAQIFEEQVAILLIGDQLSCHPSKIIDLTINPFKILR